MTINVLIAYGTLQAFFIATVLLRTENKSLFKKLFASLLIIEGFTLFERLLVETELIHSVPHLLGISYPASFIKPVLMWLMALAITDRAFKLHKRLGWHLIPFAFMVMLTLPVYFMSGPEKLEWVNSFMEKVPSYQSFDFYFTLSFFVYIGVYIFLSIKKLNHLREHVTNNVLANWYRTILIGYSVFLLFHLTYYLLQPLAELNLAHFNQISMLAMTFIIQAIAFKLVDESPLLNSKAPNLSNLEARKRHEDLIIQKLEEDKAYLDDSLTLEKFSKAIQLPKAFVTEIINQKFNCSFKKLVNQYRLNEAKRLMENVDGTKLKLIDVAYDSGFNNKVSFYRIFKELEGISPSEYLEEQIKRKKL